MKEFTLGLLSALFIFVAFVTVLAVTDKASAVRSCLKYQEYEKQYELFEANQETINRCLELNINIKE